MTRVVAIAQRELTGYLLTPIGYVIAAVFILFTSLLYMGVGTLFGGGFAQGEPASLRVFFSVGVWVFLVVAPAISMRTFSEELRSGTFETLMTSPITEAQVVLGKFLGSLLFLIVVLLPTLVFVVVLEIYGRPDYGEVMCGYAGLVLAGAAFLATGILVSTLTSSQVVAYLITLFAWLSLMLASRGMPMLVSLLGEMSASSPDRGWLAGLHSFGRDATQVLALADPHARLRGFGIGLVDTFNIVYFLSVTAVALIAAMKSLEVRRWR